MKEIYLAGGCFWAVEEYFINIKGIIDTKVGFANGFKPNPTYKEICETETGYVEACKIIYDSNIISLEALLNHLFKIIDPTSKNKQGNDIGSQYRTGIYYSDSKDKIIALNFIKNKQKEYNSPIMVELEPITTFFLATENHQRYLQKNPHGYCHISRELINSAKK